MQRNESVRWMPRVLVEKFEPDAVAYVTRKSGLLAPSGDVLTAYGVKPYATAEDEGNLVTTAGLTRLTALLTGAAGQAMTNTSVRLGVGNGAGTAAVGDTDLGGASKLFHVMDATYPSASAAVVTFKASFLDAEANFAWNEWGLDIGTPTVSTGATVNACLFNHKTSAGLGTKASGTWALTVTVTFA